MRVLYSHARRRDDEVNGKGRVLLQLGEEIRRAFQFSPRRVMLPSGVCFLDALLDFKQPPTPGDTVALERGCDRKADGLVRPALVRNDEVVSSGSKFLSRHSTEA